MVNKAKSTSPKTAKKTAPTADSESPRMLKKQKYIAPKATLESLWRHYACVCRTYNSARKGLWIEY